MEKLALLLVFPLVWPFVAKAIWKHEITLSELAINLAVGAFIVVAGWYGGRYAQMYDIEVLNGQVVSKSRDRVSCEHSYSCRCRDVCTGSGQERRCSQVCDTCYEHDYDVDWNLQTTVGGIEVSRVDRRGLAEPSRWTKAAVGDPVAQTRNYTNYIKGAPDSLFHALKDLKSVEQHGPQVPPYPSSVYDLHYLDRVLSVGFSLPEASQWSRDLAMLLRELGPQKQVNAVVVFTKDADPEFATALRAKWLGAKQNDVVLVVGTPAYPEIAWARVVSWTDNELFKVQLRDDVLALKTAERTSLLPLLGRHIRQGFHRKPMTDFEYLADEIEPPTWLMAVLFVLSMVVSVFTSVKLSRNWTRSGPGSNGFSSIRLPRRRRL